MTLFSEFGLAAPIQSAVAAEGHTTPTPIQAKAIPPLLEGHDLLGIAQTGTGKTAAFALPSLHHLATSGGRRQPLTARVLVLAPTRELAGQVQDRFIAYGAGQKIRTGLAIGGVSINRQRNMMRGGLDVLVATPGRLQDLMKQGALTLDGVELFILDEVDQMLDLGFIHAIRAIVKVLPADRQNVFFSATMPKPIEKLAGELLSDPIRVEIEPTVKPKIDEHMRFIDRPEKAQALYDVVTAEGFEAGIVFARTKRGADRVAKTLTNRGAEAHAIHGDRSQGQRERALKAFKDGRARILVATDIAARGIDITGVSHVVNFDLPNVPETYVHRIGRTGRAGATGIAISFCCPDELDQLKAIEKLRGTKFEGGPDRLAPGEKPQRKSAPKPGRPKPAAAKGQPQGQGQGQGDPAPRKRRRRRRSSVGGNAAGAPHAQAAAR